MAQLTNQAEDRGWYFESYIAHSDNWIPVTVLEPYSEAELRQYYGVIRNVTEIIIVDSASTIHERVTPLGWSFERYNSQTETWTEVCDCSIEYTAAELRAQETIQNLAPVYRLTDAETAVQSSLADPHQSGRSAGGGLCAD